MAKLTIVHISDIKLIKSWEAALEEFNQALKVSPNDTYVSSLSNMLIKFLENMNKTLQLSQTTWVSREFYDEK